MNVSRRSALKSIGAGAAALSAASLMTCGSKPDARPNVVFILADDMGYGDLACQNPESKIPTPNLDRLAGEGMRFSDAHSTSAVCTPTRYGLLTGRYCWRSRLKSSVLWCWDKPLIEPDRLTVGGLFKRQGYDTACVGKWHLGIDWPTTDGNDPVGIGTWDTPPDSGSNVDFSSPIENGPTTRGFDYYFGTAVPNFPPYCFIENERTVGIPSVPKPDDMFGCPGPMLDGWKLDGILPGLKNKAVEYIDAKGGESENADFRQAGQAPFFLYMPLTAPHTPIAPSEEYKGKSKAGAYGDFVCEVDGVVGAVLDALKRKGFDDNTLIIFSSDNGSPARDGVNMNGQPRSVLKYGHNPSHIYRGIKSDIWDGGHRVPFVAKWPGRIKPGSVSDETICLTDFMATSASILGVELPENAGGDSYDILPALTGQHLDGPIREAVVHHSIDGMFAIRQGKWKLILGKGSGGWTTKGEDGDPETQLYDMDSDPSEKNNIYTEHSEVVTRLTGLLEKYKRDGDSN